MNSVAFIHGFLGASSEWDPVRDHLPVESSAIEIPLAENWPEGISQINSRTSLTSVIAGYSMGGRLALGCALANQRYYRGLIVVSANPGLPDADRELRWKLDERACQRLRSMPFDEFLKGWYKQEVFASLSDQQIDEIVSHKRDLDPQHFASLLNCYSIAKQPNYWPQLRDLSIPVLVIVGQDDPKYLRVGKEMQRHIRDCRLVVVPHAGHVVHREQTEHFCDILKLFLSDLSKETRGDE